MRKTAGYCISGQEKGGGKRYARIELSEKVCDSAGNTSLIQKASSKYTVCLIEAHSVSQHHIARLI